MPMRLRKALPHERVAQALLALVLLSVYGCGRAAAPGAPGATARWTSAAKQGIGTSVTLESKVWFSLGEGVLTELYYPALDQADVRLLELVVVDPQGAVEMERDAAHALASADPRAPIMEQINTARSGRYRIRRVTITDPARPVVLVKVSFEPLTPGPYRVFAYFDPALRNSGLHDSASAWADVLTAQEGATAVALVSSTGFTRWNAGFVGTSDGLAELRRRAALPAYRRAAEGNVALLGEIPVAAEGPTAFTLAVGFAGDGASAAREAKTSLALPFDAVRERYAEGWHRYLSGLSLPASRHADTVAMAAMMLKAHEDKTHRGAMIASLSIPWGEVADASEGGVGGYHLVWSRDLYHVATALMILGDQDAARRALAYLFEVQQKPDGSFPQNTWLDGRPYWPSLQLDEVAYPLVLADELGRTDAATWSRHVRPAAEFILAHGPVTPQERWEEEGGYSPSTIAAEIAGLVCAASIAESNGDADAARRYRKTADDWNTRLEAWTVTRTGPLSTRPYFLRISQAGAPDSGQPLEINNGGGTFDERAIVDAGFLELVRLGIRPPSDRLIVDSLALVDKRIRVETPAGPGFYRYNHDGYGEKEDGRGYDGTGVGRLWPLLSGERGEYELAAGRDATAYLETLVRFANAGGMLPEQVWDRPEPPSSRFRLGEGTGSATPLAWASAQLIRLAKGVQDGRVPETPATVRRHFAASRNGGKR